MCSVYGIGNPLMDIITFRDYAFREGLGKPAGSMNLIEADEAELLLSQISVDKGKIDMIAGGSCANTIRGLAWLKKINKEKGKNYISADKDEFIYSGAVGNDKLGSQYISIMKSYGILTEITVKDSITGRSIIVVTPDHERTMFTHLGACREFSEDDIKFDILAGSRYLYFLGFMWDTDSQKNAIKKAVSFAKENGIKICFDLAGPFVVKRYRDEFLSWFPGNIDILLGNREEFKSLTAVESEDRTVLSFAKDMAPVLILKKGEEGCLIGEHYIKAGEISLKFTEVPGETVNTKDTTGAGDAFSAGLLYGLLKDKDIVEAAGFANYLASKIVTVAGCDYEALESAPVFRRAKW